MPIIKCTECSGTVSTLATSCPHCGAPVSAFQGTPKDAITVAPVSPGIPLLPTGSAPSRRNPKAVYGTVLGVILLLVLGLVAYLLVRPLRQAVVPSTARPAAESVTKPAIGPEQVRLSFPSNPTLEPFPGRTFRGEKWGFVDGLGREVIPAQYDSVEPFVEDRALVTIAGKDGFIDPAGRLVIPPQWVHAHSFSQGRAAVQIISSARAFSVTDRWGYIDLSGKVVISPEWRRAYPFHEGLASVQIDEKWGYIDLDGHPVIPPQWTQGSEFSEGLAVVRGEGKCSFIDPVGKLVIQTQSEFVYPFYQGRAVVRIPWTVPPEAPWGFIDRQGKFVIPAEWPGAGSFSEGLALVARSNKSGYIDLEGKLVVPLEWDSAFDFVGSRAAVRKGDKMGCIDREGKLVLPLDWDEVSLQKGTDGKVYIRVVRFKPGSPAPRPFGGPVPAEVRWLDSAGRLIWKSPELDAEAERMKEQRRRNELTRDSAKGALNKALASEPVSTITFSRKGLQNAIDDGVIRLRERNFYGTFYEFTPKGMATFGPLINKTQVVLDLYEYITPANEGFEPSCSLKQSLTQVVDEVTGIAPTPYPGLSEVEFTTAYNFSAELAAYRRYFYTGRQDKRIFKKYDDGWRVQPKQQ